MKKFYLVAGNSLTWQVPTAKGAKISTVICPTYQMAVAQADEYARSGYLSTICELVEVRRKRPDPIVIEAVGVE